MPLPSSLSTYASSPQSALGINEAFWTLSSTFWILQRGLGHHVLDDELAGAKVPSADPTAVLREKLDVELGARVVGHHLIEGRRFRHRITEEKIADRWEVITEDRSVLEPKYPKTTDR